MGFGNNPGCACCAQLPMWGVDTAVGVKRAQLPYRPPFIEGVNVQSNTVWLNNSLITGLHKYSATPTQSARGLDVIYLLKTFEGLDPPPQRIEQFPSDSTASNWSIELPALPEQWSDGNDFQFSSDYFGAIFPNSNAGIALGEFGMIGLAYDRDRVGSPKEHSYHIWQIEKDGNILHLPKPIRNINFGTFGTEFSLNILDGDINGDNDSAKTSIRLSPNSKHMAISYWNGAWQSSVGELEITDVGDYYDITITGTNHIRNTPGGNVDFPPFQTYHCELGTGTDDELYFNWVYLHQANAFQLVSIQHRLPNRNLNLGTTTEGQEDIAGRTILRAHPGNILVYAHQNTTKVPQFGSGVFTTWLSLDDTGEYGTHHPDRDTFNQITDDFNSFNFFKPRVEIPIFVFGDPKLGVEENFMASLAPIGGQFMTGVNITSSFQVGAIGTEGILRKNLRDDVNILFTNMFPDILPPRPNEVGTNWEIDLNEYYFSASYRTLHTREPYNIGIQDHPGFQVLGSDSVGIDQTFECETDVVGHDGFFDKFIYKFPLVGSVAVFNIRFNLAVLEETISKESFYLDATLGLEVGIGNNPPPTPEEPPEEPDDENTPFGGDGTTLGGGEGGFGGGGSNNSSQGDGTLIKVSTVTYGGFTIQKVLDDEWQLTVTGVDGGEFGGLLRLLLASQSKILSIENELPLQKPPILIKAYQIPPAPTP